MDNFTKKVISNYFNKKFSYEYIFNGSTFDKMEIKIMISWGDNYIKVSESLSVEEIIRQLEYKIKKDQ